MDTEEYLKLQQNCAYLGAVLPLNVVEHIKKVDSKTKEFQGARWKKSIKWNMKHLLPKYGWINDGFAEIGRYKGVIAVGAGASFKRNEDVLKMVSLADGTRRFELQDFIIMVSNHQLKPCLEKGIIPHFALLADGSPDLKKQFDVGENGKATILIASVQAHPDVLNTWKGPIKFVIPRSSDIRELIAKYTKEDCPEEMGVVGGGNVLNMCFMLSLGLFRTSVWMCVGNDMGFVQTDNIEETRTNYYADGDYSTNMASKRDEASRPFSWMGFEYPQNPLGETINYINMKLFNTSPQLFVYKSWLESTAYLNWQKGGKFTVYNCSEQGILGVVLKEEYQDKEKADDRIDQNNWLMMDEIAPRKWRTRKLYQAIEEFHKAKEHLMGTRILH